eukprot:1015447-Amphidinium_carterae.1
MEDATRSELTYNALATVPSKEILSATKCLPTVSSQMEVEPTTEVKCLLHCTVTHANKGC